MAEDIGLAATWNDQIAREVGLQIGRDARARGVHFMLGPGVNIYKSPRNGRNFEYFG
jgi:beta-glucosidase